MTCARTPSQDSITPFGSATTSREDLWQVWVKCVDSGGKLRREVPPLLSWSKQRGKAPPKALARRLQSSLLTETDCFEDHPQDCAQSGKDGLRHILAIARTYLGHRPRGWRAAHHVRVLGLGCEKRFGLEEGLSGKPGATTRNHIRNGPQSVKQSDRCLKIVTCSEEAPCPVGAGLWIVND